MGNKVSIQGKKKSSYFFFSARQITMILFFENDVWIGDIRSIICFRCGLTFLVKSIDKHKLKSPLILLGNAKARL